MQAPNLLSSGSQSPPSAPQFGGSDQSSPQRPEPTAQPASDDAEETYDTPAYLDADSENDGGNGTYIILPETAEDLASWIQSTLGIVNMPQDDVPTPTYNAESRPMNKEPVLLLDIGSVGNLCGDQWAKNMAQLALSSGRKPQSTRRDKPLAISGVGHGSQKCTHNCLFPIAIKTSNGYMKGTFEAPTVPKSNLPALLGLDSLRRLRAVIDCRTMKVHFIGPGDFDIQASSPPGTKCIQCLTAPSGHMVVSCADFAGLETSENNGGVILQDAVLHADSSTPVVHTSNI